MRICTVKRTVCKSACNYAGYGLVVCKFFCKTASEVGDAVIRLRLQGRRSSARQRTHNQQRETDLLSRLHANDEEPWNFYKRLYKPMANYKRFYKRRGTFCKTRCGMRFCGAECSSSIFSNATTQNAPTSLFSSCVALGSLCNLLLFCL